MCNNNNIEHLYSTFSRLLKALHIKRHKRKSRRRSQEEEYKESSIQQPNEHIDLKKRNKYNTFRKILVNFI